MTSGHCADRFHFEWVWQFQASSALSLKTASELTTRLREAIGSRELKLDEAVARIVEIQCHISDGHTSLNAAQGQFHEKNEEVFELQRPNRELCEKLAKKAQGRKHDNAAGKLLEDGRWHRGWPVLPELPGEKPKLYPAARRCERRSSGHIFLR